MKKLSFDVLTFGSVTLDTFISMCPFKGKDLYSEENFVIPIGEKIKICDAFKSAGGSCINASAGFSALGLSSAAVGFVGDDEIGTFILRELKKRKISTRFISISPNTTSSFSVILNTPSGKRTVFHYRDKKEDFDAKHLLTAPQTKAVYIGHLYTQSEDMLAAIPEWKKKNKHSLLGWNPGKTQFERGFRKFKKIFPFVDLLILNKEESEQFTDKVAQSFLYNKLPKGILGEKIQLSSEFIPQNVYDMREIANVFLKAGVQNLVITDGARGAQFFDQEGGHFYSLPVNTRVKSTLGAGDAFAVGVMTALIQERKKEEFLFMGSWCSAFVLQEFGALSHLITKKEMDGKLKSR